MPHIQVFSEVPARDGELDALRQRLADVAFPAPFALVLTESRLELRKLDEPKLGPSMWTSWKGRWPIGASSVAGAASPSPRRWD